MKLPEFYKRLASDLYDNTHVDHQAIVKDLKITSLHQVLGIFRSVMIRNNLQLEEAKALRKELKTLANVIGIDDKDL